MKIVSRRDNDVRSEQSGGGGGRRPFSLRFGDRLSESSSSNVQVTEKFYFDENIQAFFSLMKPIKGTGHFS